MLLTASHATPHGPSGFSLALMTTASFGKGWDSAFASIGSVTMRMPAAATAAAAETCRNERRERRERSLTMDMSLYLLHVCDWGAILTKRTYHVLRARDAIF